MSPEKHLCSILKKVTSRIKYFYISLPKPDMLFSGFGFLFSPSPATTLTSVKSFGPFLVLAVGGKY